MKKMVNMALAVAIFAAIAFSQSAVYAFGGGSAPEDAAKKEAHFKKMTEELSLTPKQQEQLTKDREEFASRSKELREKIRAAQTSLKAELEKPVPDKASVSTLVTEIKEIYGQKIQGRVDKIMAMKQVLTPEQYNKMMSSVKDRKNDKHRNKDKQGRHGDKGGEACMM